MGLKSCPFCQGTNIKTTSEGDWYTFYTTGCHDCGASAGSSRDKEESISIWEARAEFPKEIVPKPIKIYSTYKELLEAYKSGELTEPLTLDSDYCSVHVDDVCVFKDDGSG